MGKIVGDADLVLNWKGGDLSGIVEEPLTACFDKVINTGKKNRDEWSFILCPVKKTEQKTMWYNTEIDSCLNCELSYGICSELRASGKTLMQNGMLKGSFRRVLYLHGNTHSADTNVRNPLQLGCFRAWCSDFPCFFPLFWTSHSSSQRIKQYGGEN